MKVDPACPCNHRPFPDESEEQKPMKTPLPNNRIGRDRNQPPPSVPRKRGAIPFRLDWRLCLTIGGHLLTVALLGLAIYLWQAPLSSLTIPWATDAPRASPATTNRGRSGGGLEVCLRQVKVRNLFKPSIPVPTEDGVGKSTAQELAERLKFLGIMDDVEGLAALVFIPNRGPGTFRAGDRVAEFVLKDVQVDRLTLELGDEKAILKR